jgi:hypothetical protein
MKQRDLWIGILLIALGLLLLIGPTVNFSQYGWPFFVLLPGIALLFIALTTTVSNSALAVPGAIVTVIGLILLVFSLTDHWQGWSYAWALIITATGVGNYLRGKATNDAALVGSGTRTALYGVVAFVGLGLFFELFVFGARSAFMRWVLPIGMIAAGGVLLYLNSRNRPGAAAPAPVAPIDPAGGRAAHQAMSPEADEGRG